MSKKLGSGSTKNGRDSVAKRLGLKCTHNQRVTPGSILLRQRGTRVKPGRSVGCGRDHTLYALSEGFAHFSGGYIHVKQIL